MKKDSHKQRILSVYNRLPKYDIDNNESVKQFLNKLIEIYRFNYKRMILSENLKEIREWLYRQPLDIDHEIDIVTRLYMVIHDIKKLPSCKICGNEIEQVSTIINGFNQYCNSKCSMADNTVREKIKQSNLKKYGCENASSSPIVRQKVKNTFLERYGVENPMDIDGSIEKIKKTKLERYGDEKFNNMKKNKETCLRKYGVEFSTQTEIMKQHSRETCLKRYGVENAGWTEESQRKIKQSNLERFGVEFSMQNPDVKEKSKKTFLSKYGVTTPFKLDRVIEINSIRTKRDSYNNYVKNSIFDEPCFSVEEYIKDGKYKELPYKCKKCGNIFYTLHKNGLHSKCPLCFPVTSGTSIMEQDLFKLVNDNTSFEISQNNRHIIKPYEIDIYIPDLKIGIEFDGLYWHSILQKEPDYHKNKVDMAEKLGIRLINIFESDWVNRNYQVRSFIKNILNCNKEDIFGYNIIELNRETSKSFVENNSLYSFNSSINICIEKFNNIIALAGFSKSIHGGNDDYVLDYFCSKNDMNLKNYESILLEEFIKRYKPENIINYMDRRYDDSYILKQNGFEFVKRNRPRLWYFKQYDVFNRFEFRKEVMKNKLEVFDENKTDIENMLENNYNAIYDCGVDVYVKTCK